ncbi:CapA family protein [Alkalimonas delamerensis]|uniref:CapA family protein n=1 Tax=Alkalimonas delamerensis TaxID=265981 RepID=A0ABT9GMC5_9GAMM|nr:CapA family protein [Alkalimonas delamerensis]MDP4528127.1 CapA family protein [Alkalimonas delamerensis]
MVRLAFAGDLCLTSVKHVPYSTAEQAFADIAALFEPFDIAFANLECCCTESSFETIRMSVPIEQLPPLQALGVDVFCLANNHVKDAGADALLQMQRHIQHSGCQFVGAGANAESANRMLVLESCGLTLGVLNVTDASHYAASAQEAGVAALHKSSLLQQARRLSAQVDALVVIVHADLEFTNYPAPWRVRLSRALAPYCKVVVHHHPHTLQGVEVYKGCVIAYSLGNFVFPVHRARYMHNRPGQVEQGMVLAVSLVKQAGRVEAQLDKVIPTRIGQNGFLTAVTESQQLHAQQQLALYSSRLGDAGFLRAHHFQLCKAQFKKFVMGTYYTYRKEGIQQAFAYVRMHFRTDQHRNWLKSFFTFGFF